MKKLNNTVDILKILPKTNCRACMEKTCLAFAASVFQGKRELSACPHLPEEYRQADKERVSTKPTLEEDYEQDLNNLKQAISSVDLSKRAASLGGTYENGRLTLSVMGKPFHIYDDGRLSSDIHINPWVSAPILTYILEGKGLDVKQHWMPFRELPGGSAWAGLFGKRCEAPLKTMADNHEELFEDLVHMFSGRTSDRFFDSDINLTLYPLPKVPILICYDKPEDGMESAIHIFFDETAPDNIGMNSIYGLTAGLVTMFEKISRRHGSHVLT